MKNGKIEKLMKAAEEYNRMIETMNAFVAAVEEDALRPREADEALLDGYVEENHYFPTQAELDMVRDPDDDMAWAWWPVESDEAMAEVI